MEAKGFEVAVPTMPHTDELTIEAWVEHLSNQVGEPDENTYLIGHSIGTQTIMRYLASLENKKIGGIVLVAGFFELPYLEDEEIPIAKPWLETPINLEKVKNTTDNITVILSDNDPDVPFERTKQAFEEKLNAKIVVEHKKGHFDESTGIKELPSALKSALQN